MGRSKRTRPRRTLQLALVFVQDERAKQQREVLRFNTVSISDDSDDDSSTSSLRSVDSDAPFSDHLRSGASRVFGVPALRPKQEQAVQGLIFDKESKGRLIVVDRAGGGKAQFCR